MSASKMDRKNASSLCRYELLKFNSIQTSPVKVMVQYLCGTDAACGTKEGDGIEHDDGEVKRTDWQKTARATEKAKHNILSDYYMIGILG